MVILELIHMYTPDFTEGLCLLDTEPIQTCLAPELTHSSKRIARRSSMTCHPSF